MTLIITVIHVLVALGLIFVVLLQKGGGDMGAAFGGGGGGSQSLFGARGSGSFMGKLTAGLATVFMITSLSLAFFSTGKGRTGSVMEQTPITQEQSSGAVPGTPAKQGVDQGEAPEAAPESAFPTPPKAGE